MFCHHSPPPLDEATERPAIVFAARSLEKVLQDLPEDCPLWDAFDDLHAELTHALNPDA